MKTLLVMGEYKVTLEGGWVNLWHDDEVMQTMPARLFPKKTVDRVVFVTELIHSEEKARARLFRQMKERGYELRRVE